MIHVKATLAGTGSYPMGQRKLIPFIKKIVQVVE